jgi:hypothetical protein
MTITTSWPPNGAGGWGTAENSNSTYGPIVPLANMRGLSPLPGRGLRPAPPSTIYRYIQFFGHS